MQSKKMSVEDAKAIFFGNKKTNKHIWDKYETPYDTAVKTLKSDAESAPLLKEKGLPVSTIATALTEAGKIGLERNARFAAERDKRRKIIADRIKLIRQTNKLTQDEISEIIDWNALTYRGYENCKSDVPMVILLRLADYYEVSMDYLTGRTDNRKGNPENDSSLEERVTQLEQMLKKLT